MYVCVGTVYRVFRPTDLLVVVLPRYIACNSQQAHRHYYCDLGQNYSDNKCKIVKGKVIGGGGAGGKSSTIYSSTWYRVDLQWYY
jgi:hypothetical protein